MQHPLKTNYNASLLPATPLSDRVLLEAVLWHLMQGTCLLLMKLSPQSPVRYTTA